MTWVMFSLCWRDPTYVSVLDNRDPMRLDSRSWKTVKMVSLREMRLLKNVSRREILSMPCFSSSCSSCLDTAYSEFTRFIRNTKALNESVNNCTLLYIFTLSYVVVWIFWSARLFSLSLNIISSHVPWPLVTLVLISWTGLLQLPELTRKLKTPNCVLCDGRICTRHYRRHHLWHHLPPSTISALQMVVLFKVYEPEK